MSNKQLPPELVEKYERVIDEFDDSESIFRILHLKTKCAKIAVDYARPFKYELSKWIGLHEAKDQKLKETTIQRNELLNALKSLVMKHETYIISNDDISKINQLINRIYGK